MTARWAASSRSRSGRVARGQLEWRHLEALAPAFDAALRRPVESPLLGFSPEPEDRRPRRALWSAPAKVWLWEARIAMPGPLKEALADEVVAAREEHQGEWVGVDSLLAQVLLLVF